jgi:tRNA G10  N-methylase Trm11
MTVIAAHAWPSNAELIADVAQLGYLRITDHVLDPTYGRGVWWKKWRPEKLTTHDLTIDHVDFRELPHPDGTFDAVAFDPPYVCVGGRATTGMPDFHARFGLTDAPRTPKLLQAMNDEGLVEMRRVVDSGGIVLTKCQDYIWGGKFFAGTHYTLTHAIALGFELVDRFERTQPNPRPQPKSVQQQHARRNLSTLFVLRAPKGNRQAALL